MTAGDEGAWVVVPPFYVLLLHGLIFACAQGLFNWGALVARRRADGAAERVAAANAERRLQAAAAKQLHRGAARPAPREVGALNESFYLPIPSTGGPYSEGRAGKPTASAPAARSKPTTMSANSTSAQVTALGAAKLILRNNFAVDMISVVKMSCLLTYLVYTIDIEGGWERYNILGLAAVCSGHLNVAAAYLARLALDPAPSETSDTLWHRVASVVVPQWLRHTVVPEAKQPSPTTATSKPPPATSAKRTTGIRPIAAALDVRLLKLIGAEIDEVTYRAFVFTLYGCIAPLFVTHALPGALLFAPYTASLAVLAVATLRFGRMIIRKSLGHGALVAAVATLFTSALAQATLLWLLQSLILLPAIVYNETPSLRSVPSAGLLVAAVTDDMTARWLTPWAGFAAELGMLSKSHPVPLVGMLV